MTNAIDLPSSCATLGGGDLVLTLSPPASPAYKAAPIP